MSLAQNWVQGVVTWGGGGDGPSRRAPPVRPARFVSTPGRAPPSNNCNMLLYYACEAECQRRARGGVGDQQHNVTCNTGVWCQLGAARAAGSGMVKPWSGSGATWFLTRSGRARFASALATTTPGLVKNVRKTQFLKVLKMAHMYTS